MKKNTEVSYKNKIEEWISKSKSQEDIYNIKELSRLSEKEIKKKINVPKANNDSFYLISQRKKTWDLSLYYNDPERYFYDVYLLMRSLRNDIHEKRNSYISYRYVNSDKKYKMSIIHFTFNMIIWLPLFILDIDICKEHTFMNPVFNNTTYIDFLNDHIIEPYKHLVTHNEMSMMLAKMYDMFIFISERYGLDLGLSFSMYDFISKWRNNQELYDLNHTKIPKDMLINESENYLNERLNRYIKIMKDDPEDNVLRPLIRSEQGVNKKQLREMVISSGFKPDLSGNTYPIKPHSNLLTDGYRNPCDYVIDAVGGRKASVLALNIDLGGLKYRSTI